MQLRDYQNEALERARCSMRKGKMRPLLMAPTGAGKTAIAVELIRSALAKYKRVVFTVDRIQLIDQTAQVFEAAGLEFGVIQGDHKKVKPWEPLQLASVQTLTKRRHLPDVDLLINDEAHVV